MSYGGVGGYTNLLGQVGAIEQNTNQIATNSAVTQAYYANNIAGINANGLEAQLSLNQITTQQSVQSDNDRIALNAAIEQASKAMETSTLIAQYREKTLGLILQIQDARTANVWTRMKSIAAGFKF